MENMWKFGILGLMMAINMDLINAAPFKFEQTRARWEDANDVCQSSGSLLFPGRSFQKKVLQKMLIDGESVWLYGWRAVTDPSEDGTGRVKTLKVDFAKSDKKENSIVCQRLADNSFFVPDQTALTENAATLCASQGGALANVSNGAGMRDVMDMIAVDFPHRMGQITSDGFAKDCLRAKRVNDDIDYDYDDCNKEFRFTCLRDEDAVKSFSALIVIKMTGKSVVAAVIKDFQQSQATTKKQEQTTIPSTPSTTTTTPTTITTPVTTTTTVTITTSASTATSPSTATTTTSASTTTSPSTTTTTTSASTTTSPSTTTTTTSASTTTSPSTTTTTTSPSTTTTIATTSTVTTTTASTALALESATDQATPEIKEEEFPESTSTQITHESTTEKEVKKPTTDNIPSELATEIVSTEQPTEISTPDVVNEQETAANSVIDTDEFPIAIYDDPKESVTESTTEATVSESVDSITSIYNVDIQSSLSSTSSEDKTATQALTIPLDSSPASSSTDSIIAVSHIVHTKSETEVVSMTVDPDLVDDTTTGVNVYPSTIIYDAVDIDSEPDVVTKKSNVVAATPRPVEMSTISNTHVDKSSKAATSPEADIEREDVVVTLDTTTPGRGMYSSTAIYDDGPDVKLDDDGEEEGEDKETNETNEAVLADSSSSSNKFGLESSLWVAFSILVVAVIISIIVAIYLYRRRKTQKSKDLPAVAENGSAAPAAAPEGAVELRESPIRNSPPRDSATFKDAAYDI
ncbi:uncharacterized protein LOC127861097 [Dreissena polymorpha]|uniref:Uncharacterized protein n=1 Tax=Dreissena polymorpha TaxID=45954 RepID=A0A9D4BRQ3_DREPO|nr:uncharacterized protein LOC127861097 [Dreissena polymorpha]XP_052255433.1 uncharacterized protein LOC127861097 [Dreissena polymorpha]KAH3705091.1 hypothetical protein DPMN_080155 [Dreissena polymorpha]